MIITEISSLPFSEGKFVNEDVPTITSKFEVSENNLLVEINFQVKSLKSIVCGIRLALSRLLGRI